MMKKILGISGSLRAGSFNTALLRAAASVMPAGVELDVRTIHGIPLYDGDLEASQGIPSTVIELGNAIAEADGLLLCTPEYNGSIPGVFKNTIDWLSRLSEEEKPIFSGKPVAVIGASPGGFGTILSQDAWLSVLRTLQTLPWYGDRLLASRAMSLFDSQGNLTDEAMKQRLQNFMSGFAAFACSK